MIVYSVIIFSLLHLVNSAKILVVVPTPSISHQVIFHPLIEGLLKNNHEVVVITTDKVFLESVSKINLTEIDLHNLSYKLWNNIYKDHVISEQNDLLSIMTAAFGALSNIFENQLKDKLVQNVIRNKTVKFDLLIIEACIIPALVMSHFFEAPVIQMSSFGAIPGNMQMIGGLIHPFLYPTHYHQRLYNLTIWEKISELYLHVAFERMLEQQELVDDQMLQNLFSIDTPALNVLKNNVDMLYLNVHPIWSDNQPVPPGVLYTWGIHKKPEERLSEDLQSYLDSSKHGVIYISFGTNYKTSQMSRDRLEILIKVFSELQYNILWKWDSVELPGKSENIKTSKWVPQWNVLMHPNVKLFITQGGLQSTEEAINAGIPLIGIPMFADQEYNTEKYVKFGIGVKLNFKYLSVEGFNDAINSIFANYHSFRNNIIKLQTWMHDQPKPALDNAIWWIEYILRHGGGKHLRAPGANMSWAEYYELELILIILSLLIVLVTGLIMLIYYSLRFIINVDLKNIIAKRVNKSKKY